MKNYQKLILPLLFIIVIAVIYFSFFNKEGELGSFANFDTNNSANKDIVVKIEIERGIQTNPANGSAVFYASDKYGTIHVVQAALPLPEGIENSETVKLNGHLHEDHFHASEVTID